MLKSQDILNKILVAKEKRVQRQRQLIKKYNSSLISFTLNIPGAEKDRPLYRKIHEAGMEQISKLNNQRELKILYKEIDNADAGTEGYICIDLDGIELKKITAEIEDKHYLGRIFDFDIIDKDLNNISRQQIGLAKRKCLLCDGDVDICRRIKKHSIEDLISRIEEMSNKYFHI